MSRRTIVTVGAAGVLSAVVGVVVGRFTGLVPGGGDWWEGTATVSLPEPERDGETAVETALDDRRSRREYGPGTVSRADLGQLLWSAQGITEAGTGHRAAPSAGALYPMDLFAVVGSDGVESLDGGVYRYRPDGHELVRGAAENAKSELGRAVEQDAVDEAPLALVVCGADGRTTRKYGDRGRRRYVPLEAGHVGQNVYLQAEALGLSTVAIGAFGDDDVRSTLGVPSNLRPLYVLPVGPRQ
ncbi:SagB/ThcOx family dehydrogenase [Halorientalis pallida]|uniref:SagB/ThcOx family dehydrogenase n=1 Tax=Halorientalis pallida TaxID=2479928 RepID=A0A498L0F5_9EURY|nr:SagB/ThcOx family dehydrogenase [Halorientalis pallida]